MNDDSIPFEITVNIGGGAEYMAARGDSIFSQKKLDKASGVMSVVVCTVISAMIIGFAEFQRCSGVDFVYLIFGSFSTYKLEMER